MMKQIDQYSTRLRQQVIICEFANSENEIRIPQLEESLSSRVRRKATQDGLSLAEILSKTTHTFQMIIYTFLGK